MKRFLLALGAVAALPSLAHAQAASITINAPPPGGGLICYGSNSQTTPGNGFVYSFSSPAPGGQYNYLLGGTPCSGTYYTFTLTSGTHGGSGAFHAYSPLTDGPNSVQFQAAAAALDLASIDYEGDDRFMDEGDADTVGGAVTAFDGDGVEGERYEARYEKNWRPFEGQRTRGVLTAPLNVIHVRDNKTAVTALLSGGLEVPVQPNWSVTPRLAVGYASGDDDYFGGDGWQGTASVTSRYKFPQVGRGDLVLGNMIAYTAESVFDTENLILRNGLAYQFPLKRRLGGRQASLRFSYVNTHVSGDDPAVENVHELAFNLGVRLREQDARNRFELLRFGFLYTVADDVDYQAGTLTVGYRF